MKLDLPVMVAALLVAAAMQDILPAIPCGGAAAKIQLLPAVAFYYALSRPWQMGLFAALWAGILTDSQAMLPRGTTSFAMLAAAGATIALRAGAAHRTPVQVLFLSIPFTAFAIAAQRVRAALSGIAPLRGQAFAAELLAALPFSAIAAACAWRALARIDLMAENTAPFRKEEVT